MSAVNEWQHLAALLRERREDQRMTQRALAHTAGTTDRLISALERAERTTYQRRTLRAISLALGWSADSIDRILTGHDPVVLDAIDDQTPADLRAELARLREEVARLWAAIETRSDAG